MQLATRRTSDMSSNMGSTDRLDINGLYRDHCSILVSNHSLVELSLDSSNSSSMCSLGSLHFSSVNRDHTYIGVANNSTSIGSRNHRNTNGMFDVSSSLVEVCLGSSNSRGVFRDHSTIRVSHHGSRHSHRARINSLGMGRDHTNHGIVIASCMMEGILSRLDVSSGMLEFSLGSSNRWSVGRYHSTIFMSHHWSRHSHGSRIDLLGMSRDHTNHGIGIASRMVEDSLGRLDVSSSMMEFSFGSSN